MLYDPLPQLAHNQNYTKERDELAELTSNFYIKSVKVNINYFQQRNIPRRILYNIEHEYIKRGTSKSQHQRNRASKLFTNH